MAIFSLLFGADVSGVASPAKCNEKLVNQKYATLFLPWMPFSVNFDPETCTNHIYTILKSNGMIVSTSNLVIITSVPLNFVVNIVVLQYCVYYEI